MNLNRLIKGVVVIGLTLLTAGPNLAAGEWRRYNTESGVIEYVIEGPVQGREKVFFDRWGMREVRYRTTVSPLLGQQRFLILIEGDTTTMIDLDKLVAQKRKNDMLQQFVADGEDHPVIQLEAAKMAWLQGRQVGKDKLLDKTCRVWQVEKTGTRMWEWEWIPLKVRTSTGQRPLVSTAVSLQVNVPVPAEVFTLPERLYYIDPDEDMNAIVIS